MRPQMSIQCLFWGQIPKANLTIKISNLLKNGISLSPPSSGWVFFEPVHHHLIFCGENRRANNTHEPMTISDVVVSSICSHKIGTTILTRVSKDPRVQLHVPSYVKLHLESFGTMFTIVGGDYMEALDMVDQRTVFSKSSGTVGAQELFAFVACSVG
jgi:hypothetical protein